MINIIKPIPAFLGNQEGFANHAVPLGGFLECSGLVQYDVGKLEGIPGVGSFLSLTGTINNIPVAGVIVFSSNEDVYCVVVYTDGTAKLWNIGANVEITGATSLTDAYVGFVGKIFGAGSVIGTGVSPPGAISALANIWTRTFYLGQELVANGVQAIQKITGYNTRADLTGSPSPPVGCLVQSYLNRLYVAGVSATEDRVYFSNSLTSDFPSTSYLLTDEVPGWVTALSLNSPTSGGGTIVGELVIAKHAGIIKLTGDPAASTSSKDVVSNSVGSDSPHTFINTPLGTMFMGISGGRYNVYLMKYGSSGDPIVVSRTAIEKSLNDGISNARLVYAQLHDGFYKLFVETGGEFVEYWFDVDSALGGSNLWYGPHRRGLREAPVVGDSSQLFVFRVIGTTAAIYQEEEPGSSGNFFDVFGDRIPLTLEIPLNVDPIFEEKIRFICFNRHKRNR